MRWLVPLFMVSLVVLGTGSKLKRLAPEELTHYYALRAFMSPAQEKAWLKLKTQEDRDAWLKAEKLWDKFYRYDQYEREAIAAGELKLGWKVDKAYMTWGQPHNRERLTSRPATRSERLTWRFEVQPDGSVLVWYPKSKTEYKAVGKYKVEVIFDDDVATEMVKLDGW